MLCCCRCPIKHHVLRMIWLRIQLTGVGGEVVFRKVVHQSIHRSLARWSASRIYRESNECLSRNEVFMEYEFIENLAEELEIKGDDLQKIIRQQVCLRPGHVLRPR